jgi:ATP-binding cassette subfamily B protein
MSTTGVDEKSDLPSLAASWRAVFAVAWRASPGGALGTVFGWFFATLVAGPILALALQQVVAGRGFGDPLWIVLLAVAVVTPEVLLNLTDHVREIVRRRGEQRISTEIIRAALRPNGIEHLENPRFADRVAFLRGEAQQIATVYGAVAGQAGLIVGFALSLAVLAAISWWLVLPVLGAALLGAAHVRAAKWALSVREGTLGDQRFAGRLVQLAATASAAADNRMLGLAPWLLRRYDETTSRVGRTMLRSERRNVTVAGVSGAVQALMLAGGLALLLWLAARGEVGAGGVVAGVALLQTVLESARGLAMSGSFVIRVSFASQRYLWLLRYADNVPDGADPQPVPARLADGIRLESVTFRYPFTDADILRDISVTLPAGSTVALVGDNGAGKSTLIKLLCRYYDPAEGRITVDGTDLRSLDVSAWRAGTTAGFQDFARFEFTARDSIGVSRLDVLDAEPAQRDEAIAAAACAGGADSVVGQWPEAYDTQLGRQFGGRQPSDGQWQRIAMSRTFLRDEPLLMLLDEPTASLDPRAEHELFAAFARQTARARGNGAITVLVSHRFSTVDMADTIIVLDQGRVAEVGDHASLMAGETRYRRYFEAQAQHYRTDGPVGSADADRR